MSENTPSPTITAVPDIQASPTDHKRPKLLHVASAASDSSEVSQDDSGSSSSNPSSSNLTRKPADSEEIDEQDSPVVMAVSLPSDEGLTQAEEWWDLKMSWSGKVYEIRVESHDMSANLRAVDMECS